MEFKEQLKNEVNMIEDILSGYLPREEGLQKTVLEAMNYSVNGGGKRLRPMLLLESFRLFGGKEQDAYPFMAALEMIHSYSLVHDDLPALDDDDYRRGRLTTHREFGEDMAILAGDALLNYAYEICADAIVAAGDEEGRKRAARAFQILSKKAGIYGMVGGQTVDVEQEGGILSKAVLDFIHALKTGALIEAAMMMGGVLAGADEREAALLEQAAAGIGKAFQIQDDILDVTSTTEVLGKPVGSDEKNGKNTYVSLVGLEEAKRLVEELSEAGIRKLKELCRERSLPENEFLEELLITLIHRTK